MSHLSPTSSNADNALPQHPRPRNFADAAALHQEDVLVVMASESRIQIVKKPSMDEEEESRAE